MEQNDGWLDIADLAGKLQLRAESILKGWFPNGKKLGNEFLVGSLSGETGQSLRINLDTGMWNDFAIAGDSGGDLVSLYAAMKKITQLSSAKLLADEFNIRTKTERIKKKEPNGNGAHTNGNDNVVSIYDPFQDPTWGRPTNRWTYYKDNKPYFHVCRYERHLDEGKRLKSFKQLTQREDGVWVVGLKASGIRAPYPLFSDKIETDTVLVVEGEKTCVAARKVAPHDVVTWFGGTKNVKRADWSPVYGKNIIIWPDNDGPGWTAAEDLKKILAEHCPSVRMVDTSKFAAKYDAYDFLEEGRLWNEITFQKHGGLSLSLNARGDPHINESNVSLVLSEKYAGRIWYDDFRQKKMLDDRPFREGDYSHLLIYFQRTLNMHGMTQNIVHGGIKFHCEENRRNPVKEYFQDLDAKWDGTPRVKYYVSDVYGAPRSSYAMEVSRNFFLAMIARILNPGCKFDHMIILEGKQGIKKSLSLKALAGEEFYWDCSESMESKDFVRGLKGKMIVELSEMNSVLRADTDMVKKTLSCCIDEYVEKYETENKIQPRTCVFVGTTNESDYLKDTTGNRRFWPIKVEKEADLDYIKRNREQLFAEAVYRYKQGETYWEFKEEESKKEVAEQQENRMIVDEWTDAIGNITSSLSAGITELTVAYVLEKLNFPIERVTRREQIRVGQCLRSLGYKNVVKREGDRTRRIWVKE